MRNCITLAALAACTAAAAVDGGGGERTTTTAWPWETTTADDWQTTTTAWPWETTTADDWQTTTTHDWQTTTHDWETTTTPGWETTTTHGWETTTTVDPTACPPGWINAVEGCFLFHYTEATTWASAQYECEKLGAFLAEPQTEEQVSLLVSLAVLEQALVGIEAWWIGLTDQSHEGRWMWTHSASDVSYTSWFPGFPSATDVNDNDCAAMIAAYGFSWVDVGCTSEIPARFPPICQKLVPVTTTTTFPTTTTTAIEESTTSYGPHHVELRGGYVGEDEAWGNVYAVNSRGGFGPVCDDGWGNSEAYVVCKQLGYEDGQYLCGSTYGPVYDDFAMDDVNCNFSNGDRYIQDCDYNLVDNCGQNEGAGVACHNYSQTTTTAYPGNNCDDRFTTTWSPVQQDGETVDW